ncbi:hypothetical protein C2845_PM06G16300 [Panicum miliaceum]|uniref:Uncharacterized protein n=1 Tax=Panicum miliaceum TaxID=4540 RepID=A0A3L6RAK1_PANMI|nr:hypothetical protein C2845_PM06G16300 [Panicum miliaceum]
MQALKLIWHATMTNICNPLHFCHPSTSSLSFPLRPLPLRLLRRDVRPAACAGGRRRRWWPGTGGLEERFNALARDGLLARDARGRRRTRARGRGRAASRPPRRGCPPPSTFISSAAGAVVLVDGEAVAEFDFVPAEVDLRRRRHSISAAMEALAASGRQQEMRLSPSTRDAKSSARTRQHTRRPPPPHASTRDGLRGTVRAWAGAATTARSRGRLRGARLAGWRGRLRAQPRGAAVASGRRNLPWTAAGEADDGGAERWRQVGRGDGKKGAPWPHPARSRHPAAPRGAAPALLGEESPLVGGFGLPVLLGEESGEVERRHERELACRAPLIFRGRNEQDKLVEHELIDA